MKSEIPFFYGFLSRKKSIFLKSWNKEDNGALQSPDGIGLSSEKYDYSSMQEYLMKRCSVSSWKNGPRGGARLFCSSS